MAQSSSWWASSLLNGGARRPEHGPARLHLLHCPCMLLVQVSPRETDSTLGPGAVVAHRAGFLSVRHLAIGPPLLTRSPRLTGVLVVIYKLEYLSKQEYTILSI